jgi:hypothetical protein
MGLFDKWRKKDNSSKEQEPAPVSHDDIREELKETVGFCVNSGFFSKEDILDQARDIYEDICGNGGVTVSDEDICEIVESLIAEANYAETGENNYIRLRNVFDTLNKERIIAIHFAGYTLDDGFGKVDTVFQFMKSNDIPRRGYCFYHQQDMERAMDKSIKRLFLAFHSMNGDKKLTMEVGERIAELLKENGFDVDWDYSTESRIAINNFLWDKVYDGEDYGTDRAIRIMSESR